MQESWFSSRVKLLKSVQVMVLSDFNKLLVCDHDLDLCTAKFFSARLRTLAIGPDMDFFRNIPLLSTFSV